MQLSICRVATAPFQRVVFIGTQPDGRRADVYMYDGVNPLCQDDAYCQAYAYLVSFLRHVAQPVVGGDMGLVSFAPAASAALLHPPPGQVAAAGDVTWPQSQPCMGGDALRTWGQRVHSLETFMSYVTGFAAQEVRRLPEYDNNLSSLLLCFLRGVLSRVLPFPCVV